MKKIKSLLKSSPVAIIVTGLLIAGIASAALLTIYGSTTGTATNVQQSVVFGDNSTTKTYEVGNSDPVAGNVYYDLATLVNNASDKSAIVELSTNQCMVGGGHCGDTSYDEPGITTSYLHWDVPTTARGINAGAVRPTVVYNSAGNKYEMWYKTDEHADNIHYAYYADGIWKGGTNTDVSGNYDCPFVMKEGGKYYMVNYGSGDSKHFDIYTSDNGTNWTDKGTIYTETRSDLEKVDNPKILKDKNGYKMYFQGKVSASPQKYYIFSATSGAKNLKEIAAGDKIFTAANGGHSVLQPGAEGEWDSFRVMQPMVSKIGNKGYLMLYTGYDNYDQKGKIGYAVSNDGISWTKVKVSKEGYDTNLGINAWKTSMVKTNDNLVLFYQDENDGKIKKTELANILDSSQMTLQSQEIKPFFIKNDFVINLMPGDYQIRTDVKPGE